MLDQPTPPASVNLCRQSDALKAMEAARLRIGITPGEMCRQARLSLNSVYVWNQCRRDPRLSKFIGLAAVLGYDVVLRGSDGLETDLRDLPAAIYRIDGVRKARGVSLGDMEGRSGISLSSFYSWRSDKRDPTLANIVALAETFGFSVVMRERLQ